MALVLGESLVWLPCSEVASIPTPFFLGVLEKPRLVRVFPCPPDYFSTPVTSAE